MTLAALIATCDDAVLTAAASRGLLIRARKDVAAGAVTLTGERTAQTQGETVTLSATSLADARCTCPATGTCRHILAAVLALRDAATAPEADPAAPAGDAPPAGQFGVEAITRYAGKDWPLALALTEVPHQIDQSATSATVQFPEHQATVTFASGAALRDGYYKGPVAGHKRRMIAAAALLLAQQGGATLPEAVAKAPALATVDIETLDRAAAALDGAALALAAGSAAQARTRLFTVAVSTRAEAVPRLAAEMRGLAARLDPEKLRRADETPTDILAGLARTHALTRALRQSPDDPALMGRLARSFTPSGPRDVAFVGAETFRTAAGARGLTCAFADLETGQILRATEARAAGTDLTYRPETAWNTPIWGALTRSKLAGARLHLPDAALSPDGGLGLTQTARHAGTATLDDLRATGAVQGDWAAALAAATDQMGTGLRRRAGEALILFAPHDTAQVGFDALAQRRVWSWADAGGVTAPLALPQRATDDRLNAHARRITCGLIALDPAVGLASARLLSVWLPDQGPITLEFDHLPAPRGLTAMIDRIRDKAAPQDISTLAPIDPLRLFFDRALEDVLTALPGTPGLSPGRIRDAEALGLGQILSAHRAWVQTGTTAGALHLAYLLGQGRDMAAPG